MFLSFVFLFFAFSIYYSQAADGVTSSEIANSIQGSGPDVGSGFWGTVAGGFMTVVNIVLYGVLVVVSIIMFMAGVVMDWAINPQNFLMVVDSQAVLNGWRTVRDMLNLAFIFVLLFSAFCTIFQVEKYHLKKILLTLVIMALLVNFSFPVARFIIDTSNVMMYYMINTIFPDAGNGLSAKVAWAVNIQKAIAPDLKAAGGEPWRLTIMLIATIIFTFLFAITLLVISMLLVVRIVVLAILVIFAPVGFVAAIFPGTKSFSDSWWTQLFKQSFFGPIMIFMISLAVNLMNEINSNNQFAGSIKKGVVGGFDSYSTLVATGALMAVPIVLLWTGMIAAQKLGAAGAGYLVGKGAAVARWPARMMGRAAKYGAVAGLKKTDRYLATKKGPSLKLPTFTNPFTGKKYGGREIGLANLSPRAFVAGWKQRAQEVEDRIMKPAAGAHHDKLNKFLDKSTTNYQQLEADRLVTKKEKEFREVSEESDYLNSRMSKIAGNDTEEARNSLKAIFRILYGNNDQDELMDFIKNNLDKSILPGNKTFRGLGFNETNSTVSAENVTNAVETLLKNSGANDEEINKELLDLGNVAATKGGIGFGAVRWDPAAKGGEGAFVRAAETGQQAYATAAKIMTVGEAQGIPKSMHRNHFTDQSGKLNEEGKALLRIYASPTAIKHIERHKPDFYKRVGADRDVSKQMYAYAAEMVSGEAKGYNPKTKKHGLLTEGMSKEEVENLKNQGKEAAAWIVALQRKSGVSENEIMDNIEKAGFGSMWKEIDTVAGGHTIKGKEQVASEEKSKKEAEIIDEWKKYPPGGEKGPEEEMYQDTD